MSERLLTVKNLNIAFDTGQGVVHAARDVNFHVDEGEVLGIVGESGSGKTVSVMSCLGLLSDNERVVSGEIWLDDKNLSYAGIRTEKEKKDHERFLNTIRGSEIGMIFQDPMTYLNPVLTIGTQMTEGIMEHRKCSRQQAWEESIRLLEQVGIPNPRRRMHQYPYEFSGGMRQRIVIACALSCNPRLLIADEPTTALDVTVQAQILELLKERTRQLKTAVIMITHDLGVVASMCRRIVIMYGGRVVEEGTADEVFYEARHPYTQGLLQSVVNRKERGTLASIPGTPPDLLKINRGCPFMSRCPKAMKICKDYQPARTALSETHSFSCWLYCREQAPRLVKEQDEMRGEGHG